MTPSRRRRITRSAIAGLVLLGLLLGLAGWRRREDARTVRALWAALSSEDRWSRKPAAWWDLSEARPGVKREILAASLRQESFDWPDNVLHAVAGLHPDGLALLLEVFRSECGAASLRTRRSRTACAALSAKLPPHIRGGYLVQAIASSSNPFEIQDLAEPLRGSGTDSTLVRRHIARLLATSPPESAFLLLGALDALGAELPPREADRALDTLSLTDSRSLAYGGGNERQRQLLGRVRQRASPAAVERARARLLTYLREPSSRLIREGVLVLQALGQEELPPDDASVIATNVLARFRSQGSRELWLAIARTRGLVRTFEILRRDVPAETLEAAARDIFARIGQPGFECGQLDPLLYVRPIWAKLPPAVAQELQAENLRRLLTAEEPSEAFCLGTVLAGWDDLPPADTAAAWRRLFGLARFRIRPAWTRGDSAYSAYSVRATARTSLAGIAARLAPDDAAKAWMMITGGEERRHPASRQMVTASLPSLGKRLPPTAVAAAGEALLPLIRVDNGDLQADLLAGAAALGPGLPAAIRHQVVELSVAVMRRQPSPVCVQVTAVAEVAGPEDLPALIDLVKWPTCSEWDRSAIVEKITRLTGTSFGQEDRFGHFHFDLWAFAAWARRHGHHPEVPPRRGPAAREVEALWAGLDPNNWSMAEEKATALWDVSAASPGVRREVLERAFADPQNAVLFVRQGGRILHAAVGFQPAGRSLLRTVFHSRCGASSLQTEVYRQVCVALIEALPPREIPAEYLTQALTASSDPLAVSRMAGLLSLTGTAGSTSAPAQEHIGKLLATVPADDAESALLLFRSLATLGDSLPAPVADQALDALDVADRWQWFSRESDLRRLRQVRQRAGPAAVARARARLVARLRTDPDPPVEALVPALRALGQELAPADAEAVAATLLSHFWDQDLPWSSSAAANARRLLASFDALHREVPAETVEGAARAIFSRIDRPAGCFLDDPATLRPIWARLSPRVAAELRADNLKRLLTAAEPSAVLCLGTTLAAWEDLPPGDAAAAWQKLLLYEQFRPSPRSLAALAARLSPDDVAQAWRRKPALVRAAAALGPGLPASVRRQAVERDVEAIRDDPDPFCGTVAALAGPDDLGILAELMQWPTCPPADHEVLARKITELTGTPFGREDGGGTFHFDRQAWADWATQHGFLRAAPPRRAPAEAEPPSADLPPAEPWVERTADSPPTVLEEQARELRDLQDRHQGGASVLAQINRAMPDFLWLDRLTLTRRRIEIEGHAFHLDAVADFIEDLDWEPRFDEPVLREAAASGGGTYSFSLRFDTGAWRRQDDPGAEPLPPPPQPTPRNEIPGLHQEIRELLARSGLPVQHWVAGASTLEMRLEPVTYAGTVRFLTRLSRLSRLAVVERLAVTSDPRDTRKLAVDLVLETPVAPGGPGLRTTRDPAASQEADEELALPVRDPFWDLRHVRTPAARGSRPPGIAGLFIVDLRLLGIRKSGKGCVARVRNSLGEIYLLRRGDQLFDGDVVSVSPSELVFKQIVLDPTALQPFREVVKRLPAAALR